MFYSSTMTNKSKTIRNRVFWEGSADVFIGVCECLSIYTHMEMHNSHSVPARRLCECLPVVEQDDGQMHTVGFKHHSAAPSQHALSAWSGIHKWEIYKMANKTSMKLT